MADRETIINAIEKAKKQSEECAQDSIIVPFKEADMILALLKEQEAVEPVMVPHSRGMTYNCGACGTEIAVIRDTVSAGWAKENIRYCQRCGRAVKLE